MMMGARIIFIISLLLFCAAARSTNGIRFFVQKETNTVAMPAVVSPLPFHPCAGCCQPG